MVAGLLRFKYLPAARTLRYQLWIPLYQEYHSPVFITRTLSLTWAMHHSVGFVMGRARCSTVRSFPAVFDPTSNQWQLYHRKLFCANK
jgi:hypothetical protein